MIFKNLLFIIMFTLVTLCCLYIMYSRFSCDTIKYRFTLRVDVEPMKI